MLETPRASRKLLVIILVLFICPRPSDADIVIRQGGPGQLVNKFHFASDIIRLTHSLRSLLRDSQSSSTEEVTAKPSFCHDLDCPGFTVVNKTTDYELRDYVTTKWVSTSIEGVEFDAASSEMFSRLFNYIQGNNARKEKIAMTAPVLISVTPGPGPSCGNNFTMSFFISPKLTNPPAPTDQTVYLSQLPHQMVYVGSFGGFASKDSWLQHAEKLAQALARDSQAFVKDYFFTAGYDSPFKIIGRHNEVWLMAQN